jgi:hypothetical protein
MQETPVAVKRALAVSFGSAADGNIDEAVAQPPDLQRLSGIRNGLVADILASTLVELFAGLLDDAEHHDQPTTRFEPAARVAWRRDTLALH